MNQIRMTTFIKTKIKESDEQTNIDKSRVEAHILLQNIIKEQNLIYYAIKEQKKTLYFMRIGWTYLLSSSLKNSIHVKMYVNK